MKKLLILLVAFKLSAALAQNDASRILTGSAQPPLPFNMLTNTGFEDTTTGWSVTSGTFSTTTTFDNVARGRKSATWTVPASVSGFIFQAKNTEIPAGLYGRSCVASMLYKGTGVSNGALAIEAFDGTTTLGTKALSNVTNYTLIRTETFTCPTSGSLRLRIRMTAACPTNCPTAPTTMYFDEMYLGDVETSGSVGGGAFDVTTGISVTNGGSITSGSEVRKIIYVAGSGGAAVTASAVTPLTAGTTAGYERVLIGSSDSAPVEIPTTGNIKMNGPIVLNKDDAIYVVWDAANSVWIENSRSEK